MKTFVLAATFAACLVYALALTSCGDDPMSSSSMDPLAVFGVDDCRIFSGDTITIRGSGFGTSVNRLELSLDGMPMRVIALAGNSMTAIVPDSTSGGEITVRRMNSKGGVEVASGFLRVARSPHRYSRLRIVIQTLELEVARDTIDRFGNATRTLVVVPLDIADDVTSAPQCDICEHSNGDTIRICSQSRTIERFASETVAEVVSRVEGYVIVDTESRTIKRFDFRRFVVDRREFIAAYRVGSMLTEIRAVDIPFTIDSEGALRAVLNSENFSQVIAFRHSRSESLSDTLGTTSFRETLRSASPRDSSFVLNILLAPSR